jgi:hypothetical protein
MIAAPGALGIIVRGHAQETAAAPGALETLVQSIATAQLILRCVVKTACTLGLHLKPLTKNAWAYHAAITTTSINARRATTHRFTNWPMSNCPLT